MEFRPCLNREDIAPIARGAARLTAVGGLFFVSTASAFAENRSTQIPEGAQLAGRPPFAALTIIEGNVWEQTSENVRQAKAKFGISLSAGRELEAVNAIKNLTAYRNGRDLNELKSGESIDYPVEGAIGLIVQALAQDPSHVAETSLIAVLRQGIDIIANPPAGFINPEDFMLNPTYRIIMEQVNSVLEVMLTLKEPAVSEPSPKNVRVPKSAALPKSAIRGKYDPARFRRPRES